MCIAIICFPDCDVKNFEIKLIFLIKPFFYMTKNQGKNLNILKTKRAFKVIKKNAFFLIFKELSVAKNILRPESAPLCYFYTAKRRFQTFSRFEFI